MIQCNEISQTINELLIAFQDCNKIKNEDLRKLVELVAAVNTCSNGGPAYDTSVSYIYEPVIDTIIAYPIDTFHAISLVVTQGNVVYNGFTLTPGTSFNEEYTNLNQSEFSFTALAGSKTLVVQIIETI